MADIERISVEETHQKVNAHQALLVCAYDDEAKCRMVNLEGSISLKSGDASKQAVGTDIAYIRTWQGWLYLAVVMDLFSRKIVGWSAGPSIHRELVLDAVLMAVRRRRPRGTLIHSDQGTQYSSDAWRRFCRSNRLKPSMSRKGTAGTMLSPSPSHQIEEGADQEADLQEPRAGVEGCGRSYRSLLQSNPPAQSL